MNNPNKFLLSNYSLTYQLFFINLFASFLGFLSLIIFNFYLIQNDRNTNLDFENALTQINKITKFLESNSILRVPLFNENCENTNKKECEIIISEPVLDPTSTQKFIVQNFLETSLDVKVYNDSWIKFVDTNDVYIITEVEEVDINTSSEKSIGIVNKYRFFYIDLFNKFRNNFIRKKYFQKSAKIKSEINIVSETIKNKKIIKKRFINKDNDIIQLISSPIVNNNKIFGVVIVSYNIISNNYNLGLTSFNLFNFYILLVIIILLFSFFFSRSLVSPIKKLSDLTLIERTKIKPKKIYEYPQRGDEIGALSKEIKNMSYELKLQIDQLEKFAADVSHELKNPLTSLQSANELIKKNKISENNKSLLIDNMSKDIERMNRLISDISNFTQIKAEIETENFEYIEINKFFKNIISNYIDNKKNIKIEIENIKDDDKICTILANKNKLSQVFYNLIDNSISVMEKNKKILIKLNKNNEKFIMIKLYDQGKGVPINLSEKIFDRFYSDRDVDKDNHTGLGLPIAREIINSFRGKIKLIESDEIEYSGACFIIELPYKS